jgi:hypothetical protein
MSGAARGPEIYTIFFMSGAAREPEIHHIFYVRCCTWTRIQVLYNLFSMSNAAREPEIQPNSMSGAVHEPEIHHIFYVRCCTWTGNAPYFLCQVLHVDRKYTIFSMSGAARGPEVQHQGLRPAELPPLQGRERILRVHEAGDHLRQEGGRASRQEHGGHVHRYTSMQGRYVEGNPGTPRKWRKIQESTPSYSFTSPVHLSVCICKPCSLSAGG